jgi:hypothetical protein
VEGDCVHFPVEIVIEGAETAELDEALIVVLHAEIVVDVAHCLNHNPHSACCFGLAADGDIGMFFEGAVEGLLIFEIDGDESDVMGFNEEDIPKVGGDFKLVDNYTEVEHLEFLGLENERRFCGCLGCAPVDVLE